MVWKEGEDGFHIGFMFRRPIRGLATDVLISGFTGAKFVHVDTLFVPPATGHSDGQRADTMRQLFSTYIGEHFCGYTPAGWADRSNDTHDMLLLSVNEEEYTQARRYVSDLCQAKTAYNYLDLALCAMPNTMATALANEVGPYPLPVKVYCSQAAVLMLRHCLQPGRANAALLQCLSTANSRACSPMMLYMLLIPHCQRLDVAQYVGRNALHHLCRGTTAAAGGSKGAAAGGMEEGEMEEMQTMVVDEDDDDAEAERRRRKEMKGSWDW